MRMFPINGHILGQVKETMLVIVHHYVVISSGISYKSKNNSNCKTTFKSNIAQCYSG